MLRFFLGNQLLVVLLLPLFIAGYILLNIYMGNVEPTGVTNLGWWGSYPSADYFWMRFLGGGVVLLNALLLNFLFNTNGFYERNTYVVSLVYVVLMSYFHAFYELDGALIAHFLLIAALFQLFRLENNLDGRRLTFNIGFLTGLAAVFYPPLVCILPVVWLMITRIRPFVFREILLATTGFLVPLLYAFLNLFLQKQPINWNIFSTAGNYGEKHLVFLVSTGLFGLLALLGVIGIRLKNAKSSIRFKKVSAIALLIFFAGVLLGGVQILFFQQFEWLSFAHVALCLFFPFAFFYKSTQVFATIVFYAAFLFSVAKFFM
jgi:hypothetical protein